MINFKRANKYCCDDICLIKNYEVANNDTTQIWDCHHLLETDLGLTRNELIEQGKYFNVPADELIFLTRAEHNILHKTGKNTSEETKKKMSESMKGKNKGRQLSEETKKKMSESMKGKNKGKIPWNKGLKKGAV